MSQLSQLKNRGAAYQEGSWAPLNQSIFTVRLLLLIAALANPLCLFLCITVVRSAFADVRTGEVRGTVFTLESDGGRSVIPGAEVQLLGSGVFIKTVTGITSSAAAMPARSLFSNPRSIDWSFVSGSLDATQGQVHSNVNASDHYPLSFTLWLR